MTQRLEAIEAPLITTYRSIVQDETVDTADHYYGIYNEQVKTAGATGAADDFFGFYNLTEMDQAGGEVRYLDGIVNELTFTDGEAFDLDVFYSLIDANAGTVGNSIYGGHIKLDIEAGVTVGNDIFGLYVEVDTAADPTGDVIMLYLDETAGVDYGIYQGGTAPNFLGGQLTADLGIVLPHLMQSDTTDQAIADVTEEQVITFNTDVHHHLISRTSSSRFTITREASYLIAFSAVAVSAVAGKVIAIWLKINGDTIADTSTYYTFKSSGANTVITVAFLEHFEVDDYFELWMWGDNTGVKLDAIAEVPDDPGVLPNIPACPSIILTVNYAGID